MNGFSRRALAIAALAAALSADSLPVFSAGKPTYAGKMEMGQLLFFNGDVDRAIAAFQAAAELNPKAVDPHMNLLNLYIQKGGDGAVEKAEAECQEVLSRKPNSKDVHLLLGNLLRTKGGNETDAQKQKDYYDRAEKEIGVAEGFGADKSQCEYTIGMMQLQQGALDKASTSIENALKEQPNFPDAHMVHAILAFKHISGGDTTGGANAKVDFSSPAVKKQIGDVLAELDLAVKQRAKNAAARNSKAEILLAVGDTAAAADEYKKATDDEPGFVQAWVGLGTCETTQALNEKDPDKQKEHVKRALAAFQQAKQLKPDDKNVVSALAMMYERAGSIDDAVREYENYMMLETDAVGRANVAKHIQDLQVATGMQLNGGVSPVQPGIPGVGNSMFTGGSLGMPFKNLIQLPDEQKKDKSAEK